jgi:hypothetical protein
MKIGLERGAVSKAECRRQARVKAVLPVRVSGIDAAGKAFQELAHTLDITPFSARLGGVHHQLKPLDRLIVYYRKRKAEFEVVWTRALKGTNEFHVGLRSVNQSADSWGLQYSDSTPLVASQSKIR